MAEHLPGSDRRRVHAHVPAPLARVADYLEHLPRWALWVLVAVLMVAVFAADAWTGPQLALSIFYLLPVAIAAWHLGWRSALGTVAAGGLAWFAADRLSGQVYDVRAVQYWNALVRTAFFFVVAYTLILLKQSLQAERELARTDPLTGLANYRHFAELGEREVARIRRLGRPITAVYFDVDGFKAVNDTRGHHAGDDLLREIAQTLRAQLRELDLAARLGGDEFALLLPDVGAAGARVVVERVRAQLTARTASWNVDYSIGVITSRASDLMLRTLLRDADELMYHVKADGGGRAAYRVALNGESSAHELVQPSEPSGAHRQT